MKKNYRGICQHCQIQFEPRKLGSHVKWCILNPNRSKTLEKHIEASKKNIHSIETRKLLSDKRLNYLRLNPDKVPYLMNHSSNESFPERSFRLELENRAISGWIQEFQHGIYSYDFAFPFVKLDVEIDGNTHLKEKVKIIDERRDKWSIENGWKVLRFTTDQIRNNLNDCINKLLSFLNA